MIALAASFREIPVISTSSVRALRRASRSCKSSGIPIAFGVLTVNDMQQALDRCGGRHGNKGDEAATAVNMVKLQIEMESRFAGPRTRPAEYQLIGNMR